MTRILPHSRPAARRRHDGRAAGRHAQREPRRGRVALGRLPLPGATCMHRSAQHASPRTPTDSARARRGPARAKRGATRGAAAPGGAAPKGRAAADCCSTGTLHGADAAFPDRCGQRLLRRAAAPFRTKFANSACSPVPERGQEGRLGELVTPLRRRPRLLHRL